MFMIDFEELPARVGQVEYFVDVVAVIAGVSKIAQVHLPSTNGNTAKRVICLKDLRNNKINLVLWGSRAIDFDVETVHSIGQQSPVVAIFVGMLVKSYKNENTLSGGTACKWYINEEIPEIETYFDRVYDHHEKIEWVSSGDQQFKPHEQHNNLEEKPVMQLRDIDPWEFENRGYRCTVTISRINDNYPWWFSSCTKCHRASAPQGNQYRCSGGCPRTTAEPKYRLSLIGTDGTGTAEFVLFGKFARQIIGKPVVTLIRSANKNQPGSATDPNHILPEIAALVSQKFTFSVSVTQKSLTQRNVSFQVNGIVAVYGKQPCIPRCIDASATSSTHADSTTTSQCPIQIDDSGATPQKKARLDRMITIQNKKHQDLENSKSDQGADHTKLSAQAAKQTEELNPVAESGEIIPVDQNNATSMNKCPTEKNSPTISDAGKQKHLGTGKKPLVSK
ncbi:unnamed protein product [Urochloa humidicola]